MMDLLKKLKLNPKNPRIITEDSFKKLKDKILRNPNGLKAHKIVYKDNVIYAGNQRFRALRDIVKDNPNFKILDEWFLNATDWTDEQIREYIIISNVNDGDHDWDMLANEEIWTKEELEEWGVDVAGWKTRETEEDEAPEVSSEPAISKLGEVYQLGRHRLMCGDATSIEDVEKLMDGQKADMVFTDPPYGVDYEKKNNEVLGNKEYSKVTNDDLKGETLVQFFKDSFANISAVIKDGGAYYFTAPQGGDQMMMMMAMKEVGIPCRHELIWVKNSPVFSMNRLDYDYQHEPILYGWKGSHQFYGNGSYKKSIWNIGRESDKSHPTMKPVALVANAINNSSKGEDIVLDVFGGSGSTLIACEQTNRQCYMLELDEKYVDVIRKRYWKFTHDGNEEGWQDGTKAV